MALLDAWFHILPWTDSFSACVLYETATWFQPLVNGALRPRFRLARSPLRAVSYRSVMLDALSAPVYIATSWSWRWIVAQDFWSAVTVALVQWLGEAQCREMVCAGPIETVFRRRIGSLAAAEACTLLKLLRSWNWYAGFDDRFVIECAQLEVIDALLPPGDAFVDGGALDYAFASRRPEVVRYIAQRLGPHCPNRPAGPTLIDAVSTPELFSLYVSTWGARGNGLPISTDLVIACGGGDFSVDAWTSLFHTHVHWAPNQSPLMLVRELARSCFPGAITLCEWLVLNGHDVSRITPWLDAALATAADDKSHHQLKLFINTAVARMTEKH